MDVLGECRESTRREMLAHGLDRLTKAVERATQPCLRLRGSETRDTDLAVGASKLGGAPDVPADFGWPLHRGTPLAFLAQLDLAQVASRIGPTELPPAGLLSFFYEVDDQPWGDVPEDEGGWRVVWTPSSSQLTRCEPPTRVLPAIRAQFALAPSLPDPDLLAFSPGEGELSNEEYDAYYATLTALNDEYPRHQILGHPRKIQNDPRWSCEIGARGWSGTDRGGEEASRSAEVERSLDEWRLLFQIDTDDQADMMWGDLGMLYFMVRQQDLRQRRFDLVRMTLQCY